mgnify:CR=1 FL=1
MAFQFRCPQGHLLQGEESQVNQQCECPFCSTHFLVPAPPGADPAAFPAGPSAGVEESVEPVYEEAGEFEEELPTEWKPGLSVGEAIAGSGADPVVAENPFERPSAEHQSLVHVPCPKGHVLETPREMLGQHAMCPYCQAEFQLRFTDSEEYKREQEQKEERRQQKLGKAWMNWAIAVAVVVVLGVITLIVVAVAD